MPETGSRSVSYMDMSTTSVNAHSTGTRSSFFNPVLDNLFVGQALNVVEALFDGLPTLDEYLPANKVSFVTKIAINYNFVVEY